MFEELEYYTHAAPASREPADSFYTHGKEIVPSLWSQFANFVDNFLL